MLLAQSYPVGSHEVSRRGESFRRNGRDSLARRNRNLGHRHCDTAHGNLDQFARNRGGLERVQHAMKNAIDHGDVVDSVRENFLHSANLDNGPVFFAHGDAPHFVVKEQSSRVSHARRKSNVLREILQISSRYSIAHPEAQAS